MWALYTILLCIFSAPPWWHSVTSVVDDARAAYLYFFFQMRVGADTVAVDVVIVVVIGGDHFVPSNLFSTLSVARVNYGQEYIKSPFIVHETHIKTHYIEYHI